MSDSLLHNEFGWTADWMARCRHAILNKKICEVLLPGSHDTGTYSITPKSKYAPNYRSVKVLSKILPKLGLDGTAKRTFAKWAITQRIGIYQQLLQGIRYLDVRVCYCDDKMYIWHGMCGDEIHLFLEDIARFSRQYPTEILIIDLIPSHFGNFDLDAYNQFIELIELYFDSMLCSKKEFSTSSLIKDFWEAGKNIIFVFDEILVERRLDFAFPAQQLDSFWPQHTKNVSDWLAWADQHMMARPKNDNLFVLQGVLTPDRKIIMGRNNIKSIEDIANMLNSHVVDFVLKSSSRRHNILILDFYENVNFAGIFRFLNVNGSDKFSDKEGFGVIQFSRTIKSIALNGAIFFAGIKKPLKEKFLVLDTAFFNKKVGWHHCRRPDANDLHERLTSVDLFCVKDVIYCVRYSGSLTKLYFDRFNEPILSWERKLLPYECSSALVEIEEWERRRYLWITLKEDKTMAYITFKDEKGIRCLSFDGLKVTRIASPIPIEKEGFKSYKATYANECLNCFIYYENNDMYGCKFNIAEEKVEYFSEQPIFNASLLIWDIYLIHNQLLLVGMDEEMNILSYQQDDQGWKELESRSILKDYQVERAYIHQFKDQLYIIALNKDGVHAFSYEDNQWIHKSFMEEFTLAYGFGDETAKASFDITSDDQYIYASSRNKWGILFVKFDGESWYHAERRGFN